MSKRRTHSSIDRLPGEVRETLGRMLIDGEWPDGLTPATGQPGGKPTYEDMARWLATQSHLTSVSAIGRWALRMRTLERMKQAGVITREVMADITSEKASATQKAVAEMITAATIEFISGRDGFDADEIRDVAKAMKDCTAIAINADKYIREQVKAKAEKAADKITELAGKKQIDPETLKLIREQIYGIVS